MSNRPPIFWNAALRGLNFDRLPRAEVREVGRTPGFGIHHTMTAWRGESGRRYAATVCRIAAAQPFEMADAVVLFVGRDAHGRPTIISGARDLTALDAEVALEAAQTSGATEVHIHHLTQGFAARRAVLADLQVPGFRASDIREVA